MFRVAGRRLDCNPIQLIHFTYSQSLSRFRFNVAPAAMCYPVRDRRERVRVPVKTFFRPPPLSQQRCTNNVKSKETTQRTSYARWPLAQVASSLEYSHQNCAYSLPIVRVHATCPARILHVRFDMLVAVSM